MDKKDFEYIIAANEIAGRLRARINYLITHLDKLESLVDQSYINRNTIMLQWNLDKPRQLANVSSLDPWECELNKNPDKY